MVEAIRLSEIRTNRLEIMKEVSIPNYSNLKNVEKELENSKENVYNVKKVLEDEIETMKEREGHLKSTNDLL